MSLLKIKEILDVKKYNKPIIIIVVVFAITTIIIFVYNKSEKEEKFTNNQNPTILPGKDIENTSSELQDTNKTILVNEIPQLEHNIKNTFIKEYDFMYIINPEYDDNNTINNTNNNTYNNIIQNYIHIMCSKYKLNGLLIGSLNDDNELPPECHILDDKPINHLEKCRFLFVPYILEENATTILKDALSLNLPCLVMNNDNNNPEYLEKLSCINEKTGKTFNNETDFETVLGEFLSNFGTCTHRETIMG